MPSGRRIGVLSDTHGLLRPGAAAALEGCDLILHAGDVGGPEVLDGLRALAPLIAIRGNNDRGAWADALPSTELVELDGMALYLVHDLGELDLDPVAARVAAVISGHSHRPSAQRKDGVLYLNPGSAGPRRFRLPVSLARLQVEEGRLSPEPLGLDA